MKLLAVGDSFTYGEELSDSELAWPQQLANKIGFELLEELNKLPRNPFEKSKVYMLSSTLNDKDLERTKQYSIINSFLSKPLTVELFSELIDTL